MNNGTLWSALVASIVFGGVVLAAYGLPGGLFAVSSSPLKNETAAETAAIAAPTAVAVPTVATKDAKSVMSSTAILHGTVGPHGSPVRYWFEYGPDPLLSAVLVRTTPRLPLDARTEETAIEIGIFDLAPHTTYYFRIVADTDAGMARGEPASFRTK